MNRLAYLCGQNRTILNKLSGHSSIWKSTICYKPIDTVCRYIQTTPRTQLATRSSLNFDATSLTKDVMVFKYENPTYFKVMNIFALVQFAFFTYCGQFALSSLRNAPVDKEQEDYGDLAWYQKINLGSSISRNGTAFICFLVGKEAK